MALSALASASDGSASARSTSSATACVGREEGEIRLTQHSGQHPYGQHFHKRVGWQPQAQQEASAVARGKSTVGLVTGLTCISEPPPIRSLDFLLLRPPGAAMSRKRAMIMSGAEVAPGVASSFSGHMRLVPLRTWRRGREVVDLG